MFEQFFSPEPDETLSGWLENTFDQLQVVYRTNLHVISLDENNDGVYSIDNEEASEIRIKILALGIKFMAYEFNKKSIIKNKKITEPVGDFLFDTLDFAYAIMDLCTKGYHFEDDTLQNRLLEEASILISVVCATSEFALENNL